MTDYKPGTVAVATVNGKRNVRVFRTGVPSNMGWEFNHSDGKGHGWASDNSLSVTDVRPFVVLDLDDFSWAAMVLRDPKIEAMGTRCRIADQIEEQTRPAIEEPTGLGAVVEDADGVRWVRADDDGGVNWHAYGHYVSEPYWRMWGDFKAVRILSEGVQP